MDKKILKEAKRQMKKMSKKELTDISVLRVVAISRLTEEVAHLGDELADKNAIIEYLEGKKG